MALIESKILYYKRNVLAGQLRQMESTPRLIVMSTNVEYGERETQRKRESRGQASEAQREKERQRARARDKKQRRHFLLKEKHEHFVMTVRK